MPYSIEKIFNPIDRKYNSAVYFPYEVWIKGWLKAEEEQILAFRKEYDVEIQSALKQLYLVNGEHQYHWDNQFKSPLLSPLKWFASIKFLMNYRKEYKREFLVLKKACISPEFGANACSYSDNLDVYINRIRHSIDK